MASINKNRTVGRTIAKQILLIVVSLIAAALAMCMVKNGWHWEPLIWLALVWYLPLLFIMELVRKNLGTRTLLLLTTGTAIVIMFPFTEIRRAQYRAKKLRLEEIHFARSKIFWNWWCMPSKELIPACLAWRVPIQGVEIWGHGELKLDSKQLLDEQFPVWFLKETAYQGLSIRMSPLDSEFRTVRQADNIKTKINCFRPCNLSISGNKTNSQIGGGHTHEAALVGMINCSSLQRIHISNIDISESSCRHLFANHRLGYIFLTNSNAGRLLLASDRKFPELKYLKIDRIDPFDEKEFLRLLNNCPSLNGISIPHDYATQEILEYLLASTVNDITFEGNSGPLSFQLGFPIPGGISLHFYYFSSISAESLLEISSTKSYFIGCSLKRSEWVRFQKMLTDPTRELEPSARATMLKRIQDQLENSQLELID
jgi:hypothetical protein